MSVEKRHTPVLHDYEICLKIGGHRNQRQGLYYIIKQQKIDVSINCSSEVVGWDRERGQSMRVSQSIVYLVFVSSFV